MQSCSKCQRRHFLLRATMGSAAFFTVPGAFAEELRRTAAQGEGPFYPDRLPLDTDNDLITINDSITPAIGEVTHLTGRVTDIKGNPIRNALVKIWQADNNGIYIHSRGGSRARIDANFQGFGQFSTDLNGKYYFRCIKPVPYTGRPPHIHVAVEQSGRRVLTSQLYIRSEKLNDQDGLFLREKDPKARETLLVDFDPLKGSKTGELHAHFNIVLGMTPNEDAAS
ncbi:MAG: protocatechuate 3,4-dioxygenase [Planctomycetaceae bacterium]|jgi:protocatechuate 3,4-dioxygenase, beta subunit